LANSLSMMRGKTLKVLTPSGLAERHIASADEYVATLREVFNLDFPEAASLWPKILARHEQLFGPQAASANRVA
jgi:N-hydroxyarylamine O-acetyltransferase